MSNRPGRHIGSLAAVLSWLLITVLFWSGCGGTSASNSSTPSTTSNPPTGGSQPGSSSASNGGSTGNSGGSTSGGSGGSSGSGSGSGGSGSGTAGGTYVYVGSGFNAGAITGFRLNADGTLMAINGSPFSGPSSALAVSNKSLVAAGGSDVALYSVDPGSGTLTRSASGTVPGGASAAPNAAAANSNALYVGSNNGIYAYAIAGGQLTLIAGSPFGPGTDMFSNKAIFSLVAQGAFLFSDFEKWHNTGIDAWRIAPNGSLILSDSAGGGGTAPLGMAVHPNGKLIYDTDSSDATVVFPFDPNAGKFAAFRNLGFGLGIVAAADPNGKYLYVRDVRDDNGNELEVFAVDQGTGAITPIPGSPFPTGGQGGITGITFEPSGKFLLVTHTASSDDVTVLAKNPGTGALTPLTPSYPLTGRGGTRDIVAITTP